MLNNNNRAGAAKTSAALCATLISTAATADNPIPEWIDWGQLIAPNAQELYYATMPEWDTNPCAARPDLVIYGRVPRGGGEPDKDQIVSGCSAVQPNAMVAGEQYLFYVLDAPAQAPHVYRIPLDGGAPQFVSYATENAIGKDDEWVYFFNDYVIVRAFQDDPTQMEFLAVHSPLGQVNKIVTDDDYMYWTESDGTAAGAVRAMEKAGGPIFTAIDGAAVEGARDLVVTDDDVYWTELGGRIRRVPINGGPIATLYSGSEPVYSLDVDIDNDLLAFGRGGQGNEIYRMPAGGGAPTLMAFDQGTPFDLELTDGYVYWSNGSVKRLDEDAEADGVDYVIDRMEVTQAIQNGFHAVEMSADKLTYVRVYPRETVAPAPALVSAQLHGSRDGVPLPESPLQPISPPIDPDMDGALRAEPEGTYTFALPPRWVDEDVSLRAEINPDDGSRRFELDYTNNFFPPAGEQFVSLQPRGVCLAIWGVAALDDGGVEVTYQPNTGDYFEQLERAQVLTPGILMAVSSGLIQYKGNGDPFDMTTSADRGELMSILAGNLEFSDSPFVCGPNIAVMTGLVSNDADTFDPDESFSFGGQGNANTQANWTKMMTGTTHLDFNQPRGAVTLAHEIGHVLGRRHTDCGGPSNPGPYPYPPCQLDDGDGEDDHWGFDGLTGLAIHPTDGVAGDLMSYNFNRWPSDFTWTAMLNAIDAGTSSMAERLGSLPRWAGEASDFLTLRLRTMDGKVLAAPGYVLDENSLTSRQRSIAAKNLALIGADTRFALELLAEDGEVLYEQPLHYGEVEDAVGELPLHFEAVVPFAAETAVYRLVDRDAGEVMWKRTVSARAPGGRLSMPRPNAVIEEELTVSWRGFDSDGGQLYAVVQYSPDGGESWQALAVDTTQSAVTLPADQLPGTRPGATSLVRVLLSDGTRTKVVSSGGFQVERKVPVAHIVGPESGASYPEGEAILLRGAAVDAEGDLSGPEGRTSWYVDGEYVADGDWVILEDQAPGWHTAEFRATDGDGTSQPATIRFQVYTEYPAPR
ncbi:MAG: hypothetical protein AAFX85_06545 [Pseudomonadota bacterium]